MQFTVSAFTCIMRINLGLILYVSLEVVFTALEWCFSVENFPEIFFFFAKYYTVILLN